VSERTNPTASPLGKGWMALRNWLYPLANAVVVQTERAATAFPHQPRVKVIPNPVVAYSQAEDSCSLHLPEHYIVAMGRFTEEKRFDLLIRTFASLHVLYPEWHLVILGDGPLRPQLTQLAHELGVTDRILLPGRVNNPYRILSAADIFVLSSRFEGFPNALCEAMACGLAVIATDCPSGPREIIRDGVDGILVPGEDVDALAKAMARLMADENERQRLAARAPEVVDRFGLEKVMGMWEAVLSEVVTN
jgi:GalNAc-alpha-(1->4)-GalNAc-alpha-(1->3)-diNAcBac-PP-undecaprenol alpha-1,4-N-acetyl-D-galactosaminyltransferase